MRLHRVLTLALLTTLAATAAFAQEENSKARDENRESVRRVLASAGKLSDVDATFRQSTKEPYNFVATMTDLANSESLEVVVRVSSTDTISLRIYPHYKNGYINVGKLKNANALMRKLLNYNDTNFLFWGADEEGDIFSAYSFTMESGFPEEAMVIVLRSVRSTDRFVGELRPFIDGSAAA
ncbi:MAG: hypothetical protein ABI779_04030, partial [Acidobacteriota bacterium]